VTKKNTDPQRAPDLEKSLAELEKIVARLEAGELSLDDALKQFERGVALTRQCQTALREAEQRVEILLRQGGGAPTETVAPFDATDPENT
jgi:exodeoxyribonuclease VII small subunit